MMVASLFSVTGASMQYATNASCFPLGHLQKWGNLLAQTAGRRIQLPVIICTRLLDPISKLCEGHNDSDNPHVLIRLDYDRSYD